MWNPRPSIRVLKTLRTVSANRGSWSLQMVLEPDKGQCASEKAEPQRGWTRGDVLIRTFGSKGGGLGVPRRLEKRTSVSEDAGPRNEVDCEIPRRLGRKTNAQKGKHI